jgi:hypothetical protein
MKAIRWFVTIPIMLVVLFVAYTWVVLTWSYSEGERAGYVQKLSKKGWLCKTWEGEIAMVTMPGTLAEKFTFSVRDDSVAEQINKSMGKRVSLHYEEHYGVPTTCFAETRYFITAVKVVEDPHIIAPMPVPATPPQQPAPATPDQAQQPTPGKQ